MFANNEWRENHAIKENVVIIAPEDLEPSVYVRYFMLSDFDLIMVN